MGWECLKSRTIKKAKRHYECVYCGEPVLKGHPYVQMVVADSQSLEIIELHPECHKVTKDWKNAKWDQLEIGTKERGKK